MRRALAMTVLLAFVASGTACSTERAKPEITYDARHGTIVVRDVDTEGDLRERFTVRTGPADAPPMLGEYTIADGAAVFRPRFPLVRGVAYRVRFDDVETTLKLPKNSVPTTYVAHVYPSASELPANQLKFYLQFSAPMSIGDVYRHIHLIDATTGEAVPRAFLMTAHEMWNADRTRFTLILDPGRIKRGLRANLESGAPLREGASYRLIIDADWRDGDGNPLVAPFAKSFRVVAADRTRPDAERWRIDAPQAGTADPLRITFDEPLDRALLEQMLAVRDTLGTTVEGTIEVSEEEREWRLRPRDAWTAGTYTLDIHPLLEDRAGNNLQRLFDEEMTATAPAASPQKIVRRFRVE